MSLQGPVIHPRKTKFSVLLVLLGFFNLAQQQTENPEDGHTPPEITTIRVFAEPSLRQVAPGNAASFEVRATCGLDPCPPYRWTVLWDSTGIENAGPSNLGGQETDLDFTTKSRVAISKIKQMRLFGLPIPFSKSPDLVRYFDTFVQVFPAVTGEQPGEVTKVMGGKAKVRILANADSAELQTWVAQGPSLLVSPRAIIDFGSQLIGFPPTARTITLVNRGDEDLVISDMQTASNATLDFSAEVGGLPLTIRPQQSWTYRWKFFPRSPSGPKTAVLNISSNDAAGMVSIQLRGRSLAEEAAIAGSLLGRSTRERPASLLGVASHPGRRPAFTDPGSQEKNQ